MVVDYVSVQSKGGTGEPEPTPTPTAPTTNPTLTPTSGGRSAIAATVLRRLGFRDVANIPGGFYEYRELGLPVGDLSALENSAE